MGDKQDAWKSKGICQQAEAPDIWTYFFSSDPIQKRTARNLCNACPVREECLRYALEEGETWGVWGGCDEVELRRTLSVDAKGKGTTRSRAPHCPYCKSRPNNLFVTTVSDIKTGRKTEQVHCLNCNFHWASHTSAVAVRAYWRAVRKATKARSRTRARKLQELDNSDEEMAG